MSSRCSQQLMHVGLAAAWAVFILKKHALCSYESGNFIHADFVLCFFLPKEYDHRWISMLLGIYAYPNPPVLLLTQCHLVSRMLLYYILTIGKHKVNTECFTPLMFWNLNINDLNVIMKVVCVYGKCFFKKSVSVQVNSNAPSMCKNNWAIKLGNMFSSYNEKIIFLRNV